MILAKKAQKEIDGNETFVNISHGKWLRKLILSLNQYMNRIWTELKTLSTEQADKFSFPLLMSAFNDYATVKHKVLYVGKRNIRLARHNGKRGKFDRWPFNRKLHRLWICKDYHGRNSPFWRFIKAFHSKLNGDDSTNGLLWTNFFKVRQQWNNSRL